MNFAVYIILGISAGALLVFAQSRLKNNSGLSWAIAVVAALSLAAAKFAGYSNENLALVWGTTCAVVVFVVGTIGVNFVRKTRANG